jgi:putative ABC transport system substrate-binding protein
LAALAAELVELRPAVIIAVGAAGSVLAAKAATSTIPIVMAGGPDPVKYRLVESLSRPGGNITGVTSLHNELAGKRLSLLRDMVPQAIRFGYLTSDPRGNEVEEGNTSEMIAAAHSLGREVVVAECRGVGDFEPAFSTLVERDASALVVSAFPLAFNNRGRILALAARHKLPAIYPQTPYAFGGGLMSYSAVGTIYQAGFYYVPRILKGAKPADLPIQQPIKFEFVINLKTAKALGLEIPPTLLAIADEVIE